MSETFKHLAVYYYGPYVKGHTIDLDELKKLSVNLNVKNRNQVYIKESPPLNLGEIKEITQNGYFPSGNFNVKEVGVSEKPEEIKFAKEAKNFAKIIDDETGFKLKFAVIGHTHHARIVIDETDNPTGFFALIDCGAWIRNVLAPGLKERCPVPKLELFTTMMSVFTN